MTNFKQDLSLIIYIYLFIYLFIFIFIFIIPIITHTWIFKICLVVGPFNLWMHLPKVFSPYMNTTHKHCHARVFWQTPLLAPNSGFTHCGTKTFQCHFFITWDVNLQNFINERSGKRNGRRKKKEEHESQLSG
jgi:hypothetical protein